MSLPSTHLYQLWFPGETLWELWLIGRGKRPELLERCDDFSRLQFRPRKGRKVLALPANRQLAVPFVSDVSSQKWLMGAVKMHVGKNYPLCDVEGLGLQILAGKPPQTIIRIDAPGEDSAWDLPVGIDPDFVVAAPALIPLPPNSIAIWKELGQQIVALERDGKTAYYEELPARTEFETCLLLKKLIRQLEAEQIISAPSEIHLWNRTSPKLFQTRLGLPAWNDFRPVPTRLEGAAEIRPAWFRILRKETLAKRRRRTNTVVAGLALSLVSAIFFALLLITAHQTKQQQDRLAELRPQADPIHAWKAQWMELATAVDRDASVLEVWRRLFAIPSADEIRISRMQVGNNMIELRGEASTVPKAMRFIDDVSKNSSLSSFAWDFEKPELRRDGTAYFELVGAK